jgi:hypothetical protein
MIKIDKEKLTIDIDTGSQEVRDNIIENTGFEYLNDDDYILSYDTKTSIVFCTKERLLQAIEFNIEEADQEDYSNMDFSEFASVFDEELASFFLTYLESLDEDSNKYFQSMVDFIYETIYDRYSANCDYCNEEKGNYETTLLLSGKVICNDCFYNDYGNSSQDITLPIFYSLIKNADAISINDSPMITNWELGNDDTLIDTKWWEDELFYESTIYEAEIRNIAFKDDNFYISEFNTNKVSKVKLFSIKTIGVE